MASTYTSNKFIEQPGNGDYANTWNVPVNANWGYIDTALGGSTLLNATSVSGNVTLTTNQYRPLSIIISGTPSGSITYRIPSGVGGQWTVTNNAPNTYAIYFQSLAGGSAIQVASGYTTIISCDGSASGMRYSNSVPSTASGSNTYVQLNVGGYLGAYANFTYDGTTLLVPNVTASGNVAGTWNGVAVGATKGGTGQSTYTTGDILYASATNTLSKLGAGSNGYVLTMAGGVPTWASGAGGSGTVNNGTGGRLAWYAATGTAVDGNAQASMSSGTLSLGTVGSTLGAVSMAGSTAGAITVRPPANTTTWTMTLPTTTGTANQVLQTDGTGATSWVSLSSGGTVTSVTLGAGTTGLTISALNSQTITNSGTFTLGGTLAIANGGTGTTTATGSGSVVLASAPTLLNPVLTSPSMTSAVLGTPTSGTLTNCSGLPLTTGITGTLAVANGGTGVTTSTGTGSVVLSTGPTISSPSLVTPALGTPSSGTLTNCTGYPASALSGSVSIAQGGTGTSTAFTTGSVVFAGASGVYSQNNSNLFWDNTNARLGIATTSPTQKLSVTGNSIVSGNSYFTDTSYYSYVSGTSAFLNFDTNDSLEYQRTANKLVANIGGAATFAVTSAGDLQMNSGYGSVATAYGCRAWVNFNGTGTPAIGASGNVSSITDLGPGTYRVTFINAMPDVNYAFIGTARNNDNIGPGVVVSPNLGNGKTTSIFDFVTWDGSTEVYVTEVNIAVFR